MSKITQNELQSLENSANQISYMMGITWSTTETQGVVEGSQLYGHSKIPRKLRFVVPETDSQTQLSGWYNSMGKYLAAVSPDVISRLVEELKETRRSESKALADAQHWKNNHECEVSRARVLKERPDMPLERVNAYNRMLELENENAALKERISNLKNEEYIRMMIDTMLCQISQGNDMIRENNRYLAAHFTKPNGYY